jgi:hypothetical protein
MERPDESECYGPDEELRALRKRVAELERDRECSKCDTKLDARATVACWSCFEGYPAMDRAGGEDSERRAIVAWLRTLGPGDASYIADDIEAEVYKPPSGWACDVHRAPTLGCDDCHRLVAAESEFIHVVPSFPGEREHEENALCWCGPVRDAEQPRLLVHNRKAEA